MTKFKHIITAALLAAILFTLSCSDDSGDKTPAVVRKEKISGVSQKGPFVEGSTATLYELNNDFIQTGRSFRDIISDNKGTFEIRGIEIVSPYAMLEASGYYRNENTGGISKAPITLFAIADVREKDQVNVNILTHLEYYRVLNLVENQGMSVKDAKRQAQKEILAVFGINSNGFKDSEDMTIFGTSESDAALLAISILLMGNLNEGDFSRRLTNMSQAIKDGGTWNDEVEKSSMIQWAAIVESVGSYCQYPNNGGSDNCWPMPTDDKCKTGILVSNCSGSNNITRASHIKSNILSWGSSEEVPDFEKYIRDYWNVNYRNIKTENCESYEDCHGTNEGQGGSSYERHSQYGEYYPTFYACINNVLYVCPYSH